jgi:hypothetical protein
MHLNWLRIRRRRRIAGTTTRSGSQLRSPLPPWQPRIGQLQGRSASSLAIGRTIGVARPVAQLEAASSAAIMSAIVVTGATPFVSLPDRGLVAEVNWEAGKDVRNLRVGGMPTCTALVAP